MYNLKPKIMTKTLRFSLLSMLLMLCGSMYADEVKFDFSVDNAYSLFGLSGFSSNDSNAGDITENKSTTSGDVTVTVSPCDGKNPNRMWTGSLRMYGGTLTIASAGKNITAIEFTLNNNKWGNNTANTGKLETGKWTGDAASVVITVGGNTQIKSMTVTLGEGGTTPDPDPEPQPGEIKKVTVAEFNAAAESTDVWYQLSGTVKNLKDGDQYGNFDLEDETGTVYVYGLLSEKGGEKKLFQELAAEKGIKNGTKITIIGNRGSYKEKIEVLNAYFVSVDGQGEEPEPQPEETKKATIAEFNAAAESTTVWYQLSGTVKNLKDGDIYGNFDLEDETGSVYVYGLLSEKGGEKKLFQELAAEKGIKNGTKITICGNRGSYGDKIEVVNAYFVSVDGQGDTPEPQPDEVKDATIAEFNAAAESTDVWYKLKGEVKNLNDGDKYGNFDLEDATGTVYVYGLLSEKGGAKGEFQALAAEKGIKNGCKITIIGNRGSYKDKIEVTNAYFVSIDEAAPAEITISGETTFEESTVVTITPSDVDHDVYYTLDGTDPKTSSTQVRYMEPFTITETCTVRAWEEDADIYAEKTFTKAEAPAEMTVEDVIAAAPENTNATEGQQKVWVKGYIVGFVDGAKLAEGAKFTAEGCETATNLLLATNPAETNVENCIPVQLPAGDIRAALNLQDNPDNLGKEVKLYGYVLKYFSAPGLKNVTAYEFTGETGVEMINAEAQQNGRFYNLAGQRVDNAFKGIVIVNGKKIVKK